MKSMLKTQFENEEDPNSSALQGFAEVTPKLPKDVNFRARDSGYVTDFSPASATSPLTPRQFRFDSDLDEYDTDVGLEAEMDKIAICDDVFHLEQDDNIDTGEFLCDSDDREVEEFFSDSGELGQYNSVTQPVEITPLRPGAPVPTPIDSSEDPLNDSSDSTNSDVNNDSTDYSISHSYHHTPWNVPSRRCQRHMFRPISRSVGTQTPSPVSQLLTEAIGVQGDNSRFQPYRLLQRGKFCDEFAHYFMFCLICCFMSQSTAMFVSEHCLHFVGLLPIILGCH